MQIMIHCRPRHPFKAKIQHTILLLVIVLLSISPCYYVIAHPALPLPNARPPKKLFSETNANAGGRSDGATIHHNGESSDALQSPPPSQVESIVANAKSLTVNWSKQNMDLTNPTLRSRYITALTAGLAVSLAMVPEAVSFSCECIKQSVYEMMYGLKSLIVPITFKLHQTLMIMQLLLEFLPW